MRAPQTQQLSRIPPRMRNPPLQPYWYWRNCPSGERQHSATGLPAAARPLARGRFSLKYRFSIIREGWKFNARPRPEEIDAMAVYYYSFNTSNNMGVQLSEYNVSQSNCMKFLKACHNNDAIVFHKIANISLSLLR